MSTKAELAVQRDRLIERFALMQSELGGLFYEMAIRDHVKMEVLITKAAALQAVDAELSQVEDLLTSTAPAPAGASSVPVAASAAPGAETLPEAGGPGSLTASR